MQHLVNKKLIDEARASLAVSRIVVTGVAIVAALVALHGINKLLLGDGLLLALDTDPNLPSWLTSAFFLIAGLLTGALAWLRPAWRSRLAALAAVALYVSFEQVGQLHTQLEQEVADPWATIIQATIGLAFAGVIAWNAQMLPPMPRMLMVAALVAAAVSFGSSAINRAIDLPYALVIFFQTLEEVNEMLTAILIAAAVAQPLVEAIADRVRVAGSAARSR